jgi:hypothetical protein
MSISKTSPVITSKGEKVCAVYDALSKEWVMVKEADRQKMIDYSERKFKMDLEQRGKKIFNDLNKAQIAIFEKRRAANGDNAQGNEIPNTYVDELDTRINDLTDKALKAVNSAVQSIPGAAKPFIPTTPSNTAAPKAVTPSTAQNSIDDLLNPNTASLVPPVTTTTNNQTAASTANEFNFTE